MCSNILSTNKHKTVDDLTLAVCVTDSAVYALNQYFVFLFFCFQINLGSNQYLFSVVVDPREMPCFCLRHDVDALLWQPHSDQPENMWEHIATFNALGRKLTSMSHSCISDFST